jgi:hypothetical protein
MGIEPTSEAWEAALDKTLKTIDLAALSFPHDGLSWKLDGNEIDGCSTPLKASLKFRNGFSQRAPSVGRGSDIY